MSWIICQIGAREHYAIPCALQNISSLKLLITDAWVPPQSFVSRWSNRISPSLNERYHSTLSTSKVQAFTSSLLFFELRQRLLRSTGWPRILRRNHWFQCHALRSLKQVSSRVEANDTSQSTIIQPPTLFSYSYAALDLFRYAKQQGWQTMLGQIDPGIVEQQIVGKLQAKYGHLYQSGWQPAPEQYWQNWHKECELADRIIVNSTWSQTALVEAGVTAKKIAIAPLAYQPPRDANSFHRQYPDTFTAERPLRVLFLGQIILRKGIADVLDSLSYLRQQPIEFCLVGSTDLTLPPALLTHPQVKWIGPVPRSQVQNYYKWADIFLFPTHSDGFGLTQLEAQAWQLPIIASQQCGQVVKHEQNGLILPQISGKAIADALLTCCRYPQHLQQWSTQSHSFKTMDCYSLNQLAHTLQNICHAPV